MPISLVIVSGSQAKEIFELFELFYLKISVETYKKTGPSQYHKCQQFDQNCGNAPRCVKCAGSHLTNVCTKTFDQTPTCSNCDGPHTANFRGCPYYLRIANTSTKLTNVTPSSSKVLPPSIPTQPLTSSSLTTTSFAQITKRSSPIHPPSNEHSKLNII